MIQTTPQITLVGISHEYNNLTCQLHYITLSYNIDHHRCTQPNGHGDGLLISRVSVSHGPIFATVFLYLSCDCHMSLVCITWVWIHLPPIWIAIKCTWQLKLSHMAVNGQQQNWLAGEVIVLMGDTHQGQTDWCLHLADGWWRCSSLSRCKTAISATWL